MLDISYSYQILSWTCYYQCMDKKIKILVFGGSLRRDSFSSQVMIAVSELAQENAKIEIFDRIGDFPIFDQDQENNAPELVREFKQKIKSADAIIIVTPEYNYSIPGYLKNAIDWASRPYGDNSFDDKPGAIISISPGMLGGIRAQVALRQACVFLNIHLLNRPEVIVPMVDQKIKDGKLTDEHTQQKIIELLEALCIWTRRLNGK